MGLEDVSRAFPMNKAMARKATREGLNYEVQSLEIARSQEENLLSKARSLSGGFLASVVFLKSFHARRTRTTS